MSKISTWPKIARRLTADEMCIGPLSTGPDCGCLVFWTYEVFLDRLPFKTEAQEKTYDRVEDRVQKGLVKELGTWVTGPKDVGKYTSQQLADGWNRMIHGLGFVLECDLE